MLCPQPPAALWQLVERATRAGAVLHFRPVLLADGTPGVALTIHRTGKRTRSVVRPTLAEAVAALRPRRQGEQRVCSRCRRSRSVGQYPRMHHLPAERHRMCASCIRCIRSAERQERRQRQPLTSGRPAG